MAVKSSMLNIRVIERFAINHSKPLTKEQALLQKNFHSAESALIIKINYSRQPLLDSPKP